MMKILPFAVLSLFLPAGTYAASDEDCETEERLCVSSQIFLIDGEDAVPYPNSTIAITDSQATTVTFSITQDFLETNVDYIYPVFDSDGRDMLCSEENVMVDVPPGYTQSFTAECDKWGKASVELFVRDGTFTGVSPETNYRNCPNFSGARVATYKLELSCDDTPVCGPDYEAELMAADEAAEQEESGYKCKNPVNTNRYSVITRGDAEISASVLYKAVAIGGTMSNPGGNKMVIGTEMAKMSYMHRVIGKCLMDFKGYRKIGAYLQTVIDFEQFKYVARNAESRKFGYSNIIVMTRGGTFDIRDFCTVCDGKQETGSRLLIIFNTNEKVLLKGSADGLPFFASVMAPFSRVELDGSAGYIDGLVVADTFATVGDNASSLELRGKSMGGSLYCGPTEAPTWAPTSYKPETYENICLTGQILLTNDEDSKPLPDKTIAIEKAEESTVTFSITNQWKNRPGWFVPIFDQGGETMVCDDANRIVTPSKGDVFTFTAECTNGKAKVDVFIRDFSFRQTTQENVYDCPTWWGDARFKGLYSFELSCTDEEICTDYTTDPVTEIEPEPPAPAQTCNKIPQFYSIITKSHSEISMHDIASGIGIGGLLSNPLNSTVVVGTRWKSKSYINRVVDECHVEFRGGRIIGQPLEEKFDFAFFEQLARTAYTRTESNKRNKVIVMTHGGTFDTHDFLPDLKPGKSDGRNTVIIFNTDEKVILTSTADGQPFHPTVIAPFSRVELNSDAGSMEGAIIAHSFATTGSNPSALSIAGLAYDGKFCDTPSDPPAGTIVTTIEGDENNVCEMCRAHTHGDPHIITFDGLRYDAHVKGELTFLKSLDSGFEIQARTQPMLGMGGGKVMITTGVVVKDDNLPKIQVSFATEDAETPDKVVAMEGCPVQLFVDDVPQDITTGSGTSDATVQTDGKRIVVEYPSTKLQLDMVVRGGKNCLFNIKFLLGDCRCGETLVGILGNPNGDRNDDWMEEDGTPVEFPPNGNDRRFGEAYNYSKTWCVTEDTSNFAYNEGTDFETFDGCTDDYDEEVEKIVEEASDECKDTCFINGELDAGCVIDCETLGTEAGEEYVETEEETPTAPTKDPTAAPITSEPTAAPTPVASGDPTAAPITSEPTAAPTPVASGDPTAAPITSEPTSAPTPVASGDPTAAPITSEPTAAPTSPLGTTSGSLGDPHFRTWRNEHFEYHGQCDLMLATDMHFADDLGLDVQIRTKLVRFWSYIKTAAIRIGNDIFEFEGDAFPEESSEPKYWFNLEYHGKLDTIGGFPIAMIRNSPLKTMFEIDLHSKYPGQKIIIGAYKEFVRVDFHNGSEESYGNVAGILGNFKTGETLSRDGEKVIDNFTELGQEWQLRPTDNMLFHAVSDPQFPKKCIEPEDPQGERRRRLEENSLTEEEAEAACASVNDPIDRKNCVYDILATQDLDMVGAY
eukprot:scaffold2995_cov130-Cylindrotheca_fusiformis.AAC.7